MRSFDIVIVGGGIVGLTQALAMEKSGLSVAIVENQISTAMPQGEPQLRVSALTLASENILRALGAWQHIDQTRIAAYKDMQVWEQDSFGKIAFSAKQVKQAQLGYIVENQAVRHSLWIQAAQSPNIELLVPNKIKQLTFGQQECFVIMDDDSHVTTRLIIGADGANSFVKKSANFPQTFWDYEQHAIVATVKTAEPHGHIARQVFTPSGPLAFLPLPDPHLCSIVWSQDEPRASELSNLSLALFDKQLTVAFDGCLGLCQTVSDRQSYPLKMQYARQWVTDRVAIVGDAAHTIHPLAGQGANLGILDAAALAEHITKLLAQDKDFGLAKHLRPFERWRKTEALKMVAAMEGFKRLFAGQDPIKKLIRDLGLNMANRSTFAKQRIIQHAMGLEGELPELAKQFGNSEV